MSSPSLSQRIIGRLFRTGTPQLQRHVADMVARSSEEITYNRLIENGFAPNTIIDVGAYQGEWTRLANRVFGAMPMLMVEAQPGLRAGLDKLISELPHVKCESTVLGATAGQDVTFYEMGTGSSFLPEASDAPRKELQLKTRTLDDVAAEHLEPVDNVFLKIDVQGAELQVLQGASALLERTGLVQLETAMLQYNEGAPLLPDVVAFMAERGFFPTEVSGFSRPRNHLVQIDILFAKAGSVLRPEFFNF
ncbi:MAG: FkbM family methyltransferase [Parasphingorhabdus sp.]